MVEKKLYQKHTRNISTLSEISVTLDPLKRDDGLDVKVIFLVNSRIDCIKLFETIKNLLVNRDPDDGDITDVSVLNRLTWDDLAPNSEKTLKVSVPKRSLVAPNGYTEPIDNGGDGPGEWYLRFCLDGQVFRLRLINKDTKGILKTTSYDFLVVCMKVPPYNGNKCPQLESEIGDFYWKWIDKYCKKRPTILLGYCLPSEDKEIESLLNVPNDNGYSMAIVRDSLGKVNQARLEHKISAIPKFCNFAEELSFGEIKQLFLDLKKLVEEPGYFLQQCAHFNDLFHFKIILESPSCTDEVLNYTGNDKDGDNPVMIAAKLRHRELVSCALHNPRLLKTQEDGSLNLENFLHSKNKHGQTLLHMVSIQGPELEEQKLLLLKREIELHCQSEVSHESDQLALKRCMRNQLKSSEDAATILYQLDYLQGIPFTEYERKMEKCRVWSSIFFSTLLLSSSFSVLDYGSDSLIMVRYFNEWKYEYTTANRSLSKILCNEWKYETANKSVSKILGPEESVTVEDETCEDWTKPCLDWTECTDCKPGCHPKINVTCLDKVCLNLTNVQTWPKMCIKKEYCKAAWNISKEVPFQCFPASLDPGYKFCYTLVFFFLPWPMFVYEFLTSRQYKIIKSSNTLTLEEMSSCQGFKSLLMCYLRLIANCLKFFVCILIWPIAVHFIKFYNDGLYYLSRAGKREEREMKRENSEVLWNTARVMEVSHEASFQPTIQLYLLFPTMFESFTSTVYSLQIFKIEGGDLSTFEYDQTVSIITSLISLSWGFTSYHSVLKRGGLDYDLASLFYKAVLYLAILFQILSRLFIFVIFAFSFGPGEYHPLLIFMGSHCLLMMILHFVFSDAKEYWNNGFIPFLHYVVGNGFANIYIHNWIRMDPFLSKWKNPKQHISTFIRQLLFDLIFFFENLILLSIALNKWIITDGSSISELKDVKLPLFLVLFGSHLIGLILKCVYYRYIHMWAWLIMDYTTIKKDGHWSCILPTNMFFCGNLLENYQLTLCCLPRPIFAVFNFFFGDRKFECTGTSCSVCAAAGSVILFPIAVVIAIIGFAIVAILVVAFFPIFLIFILPCFLVTKFMQLNDDSSDTDEEKEEIPVETIKENLQTEEMPLMLQCDVENGLRLSISLDLQSTEIP